MKATIRRVKGLSLVGKADSSHWVPMDTFEDFGGNNAANKAIELVLLGLGGCTSMDVLSIMAKKRAPVEDFEMEIDAEQATEHPKVFTKIKLNYILYGDKEKIKAKDIERAIELSREVYCPVSNMLKHSVNIEHTYEIREVKLIS
jgi:putative redox protein